MQGYLNAHLMAFRESLSTIPNAAYKHYMAWLLETQSHNVQWRKLIALEPLMQMTQQLLDGLLTIEEQQAIIPYIAKMNVLQVYEVVSDNFAIGLVATGKHDIRRDVMKTFNEVTVRRLLGEMVDYAVFYQPYQDGLCDISSFEQSLSPDKHRQLAELYRQSVQGVDLFPIEYSLYSQLVANTESAKSVIDMLDGSHTQELVCSSLIRRYRDSGVWLHETRLNIEDLYYFGTGSIMVVPTLGYYIGVIAEILRDMPGYPTLITNNSLNNALEMAALLVRLLNDIGSHLLIGNNELREQVMRDIYREHKQTGRNLYEIIPNLFEHMPSIYTRLRKDIVFGEYNILLAASKDDLQCFNTYLYHAAQCYKTTREALQQTLIDIDATLNSNLVSSIVMRFVNYHEHLYSQPSNTLEGEYAI